MRLCTNRTEGFSIHSTISSPLPTSCFTDTVLTPLPIFLSLLLIPILFILGTIHRRAHYNPSTAHLRSSSKQSRNCLYKTTTSLYYILIVCNILMETLEIARLELVGFGIGLLPFVYVGLILGALLHWSEGAQGRIRGWQVVNAVLWVGGAVISVVKIVGLSKEGIDRRKGSKYPMSDEIIDVAVIAAVYVVIAALEVALEFWRRLRRRRGLRVESDASVMTTVTDKAEDMANSPAV